MSLNSGQASSSQPHNLQLKRGIDVSVRDVASHCMQLLPLIHFRSLEHVSGCANEEISIHEVIFGVFGVRHRREVGRATAFSVGKPTKIPLLIVILSYFACVSHLVGCPVGRSITLPL